MLPGVGELRVLLIADADADAGTDMLSTHA